MKRADELHKIGTVVKMPNVGLCERDSISSELSEIVIVMAIWDLSDVLVLTKMGRVEAR